MGFLISYTGLITLTDRFDYDIARISLGNILLETDSPFLAPQKYKGKRCQPAYLVEVAKKIARIKKFLLIKLLKPPPKKQSSYLESK